jgi:hypothetical protein
MASAWEKFAYQNRRPTCALAALMALTCSLPHPTVFGAFAHLLEMRRIAFNY